MNQIDQYVHLGIRIMLGVVFATALLSKLRPMAFGEFTEATGALLPVRLYSRRRALAAAYLMCEVLIVVLLAVPAAVRAGLALAAGALLALAVLISRRVSDGGLVRCRCFGAGSVPLGTPHVVRNLVLAALAGAGSAADTLGSGVVDSPALALSAVIVGLLAAVPVVRFDDLVTLFATPSRPRL